MNKNRSAKPFYRMMSLISAAFLFCFIVTPSVYSRPDGNLSGSGGVGKDLIRIPSKNDTTAFISTVFIKSELLSDIEINYVIHNSFKLVRNLPGTGLYALAFSLISYCIIVSYMKCYIRKSDQQVPLLASSMGGHAPPVCV